MATIANLKVNIGGDADQLISEFKRVEKSTKQLNDNMNAFGRSATKAIGAIGTALAASNITNRLISVSAEFETLKASLETVFGSQEAAALQFKKINDFASSTPFTIQQITEASIRMKSLGLDPSIRSLESMGNTAAALGKPLMQFTEAVADAVVGEFERLKEFGIKANSEGDRVKFTFQGVTTEIGKNAAEINDYLLSIGETQFSGAIEKQANTLNGVFSTLEGSLDSLAVKFAEESGLAGAVKKATIALTDFINNQFLLEPTIESVSAKIENLKNQIDDASGSGKNRGIARLTNQLRVAREELAALEAAQANEQTIGIFGGTVDPSTLPSPILGMTRGDLDDDLAKLEESLKSKEELLQEKTQNELNLLIDAENTKLITKEKFLMLEKQLTEKSLKELGKLRERQNKANLKDEKSNTGELIANASVGAQSVFDIGKNLALSQGAILQKEAVLGAYAVGSKIGGPPLGAAFAVAAGAATGAILSAIGSAGFGSSGSSSSVPSGAVPTDGQTAITDAANDEPQNKTVFINVEGIDDEAFLTKNQVRSIVDQINEERDANVRIVL